ncbi:MAG TPA: EAL domain-containing protein [Solirubrobacteraceae bacterium]|nr:EAL domain-containing protein [Solirubrobacteraceae bacterium]
MPADQAHNLADDPPVEADTLAPENVLLKNMLERVPAIIYVADTGPAGRWRYVSPQIRYILGFSPEAWCGDPDLWASRLHPDDRERVLAAEHASAESGSPGSGPAEYRLLDRDGNVVWIRDDAQLVRDATGSLQWHGVLSDVTERKQAEIELEHRAAQQAAVARLGEHALEGATTSALIQEASAAAAEILDVEVVAVMELIAERGCFVLRGGLGWPQGAMGTLSTPTGAGSQAGYTILTGAAVVVTDWLTENRFDQSSALRGRRARSGLTVPIESRNGPFGVLGVQSTRPRDYSVADVDFLQSLANVLADALERQATEDDVRHRALHDALTRLPNRVLFRDRLKHALARMRRRRTLTALLFVDLDRFKLVNDSLGHHMGDELLAAVGPRLRQAVRASDTVARFGGDEFGILLEDIAGEHDAIATAERIAAVFARPFVLGANEHFVTVSIGIAIAHGGELAENLVRDADAAMYRAKEHGRARYEVFDDAMRVRAMARLRVENDLRRALERDELSLVYQPVVSLAQQEIVGVEALLRWNHPTLGMISPAEFIPVAEESGLIVAIGDWVLEQACRQAASWYPMRPDAAPFALSVNLSAVQLAKRGFVDTVDTVLRETGLDPNCLSLEITESVLLADSEALAQTLRALKARGVRLVIDDFGTGYSALGYLTRMPLDALKVDRSFVVGLGTQPRDTAITEAIIGMSRALSLEVVAEGVETPLQIEELRRLGCGLAQGFYFSRPVSPEEITSMLQTGPVWARVA